VSFAWRNFHQTFVGEKHARMKFAFTYFLEYQKISKQGIQQYKTIFHDPSTITTIHYLVFTKERLASLDESSTPHKES